MQADAHHVHSGAVGDLLVGAVPPCKMLAAYVAKRQEMRWLAAEAAPA